MWGVLLITLMCSVAYQTVDAITCFQCSNERTLTNQTCVDPFKGKNAMPCQDGMCFKRKSVSSTGVQVVTRGCIADNLQEDTCVISTLLDIDIEQCICSGEDGCNGATASTVGLVATSFFVISSILLASY